MKDTIRQGTIAGLLGSVGDMIVHWAAYFTLGTTTTAHYMAQLVYPFQDPTPVRLLIGGVAHYFAGAFVGVMLALIFRYFGTDHPYYKGIGLAVLMWLVHIALIPNIVSPRPFILRTELETIIDLMAHLAYGAIAVIYWLRTTERESKPFKQS